KNLMFASTDNRSYKPSFPSNTVISFSFNKQWNKAFCKSGLLYKVVTVVGCKARENVGRILCSFSTCLKVYVCITSSFKDSYVHYKCSVINTKERLMIKIKPDTVSCNPTL